MSFPWIEKRLDNLKENALFSSLEKKYLIRIAFELQEMKMRIGNLLEFDFSAIRKTNVSRQRVKT